ncbi:phosphatase, partial [Streptomyces sp. NPDC052127]
MNRFVTAERALRTAAPHQLLDAVRRVLAEEYAADSVELFMADYGLT